MGDINYVGSFPFIQYESKNIRQFEGLVEP